MSITVRGRKMSLDKNVREAQRHRGLEPEVVEWKILTKEDLEEISKMKKHGHHCTAMGLLEVGRVLVVNHHDASWTMTVEEFDANYQAR